MSIERDQLASMSDEDMVDLHLVGTDGKEIGCIKPFLAARSPVFKGMFYKGFREQLEDRCNLDFHSIVIQIIVKHCVCNELDFDPILQTEMSMDEEAAFLIGLRKAGNYFELGEVILQVEKKIVELVVKEEKMRYAGLLLAEFMIRDEDDGPFWDLLFQLAVANPIDCFGLGPETGEDHPHVHVHVHPSVLARVLASTGKCTAVACLQTWFADKNKTDAFDDHEKQVLCNIATNIDLRHLSFQQLSKTSKAAEEGNFSLFPMEKIHQAFVHRGGETPIKIAKLVPRYYVYGAGMNIVDGVYVWDKRCRQFTREAEYKGEECVFALRMSGKGNKSKWRLDVIKFVERRGLMSGGLKPIHHFYQAPLPDLKNEMEVPLAEIARLRTTEAPYDTWECDKEGDEPSPIVIPINLPA
ncbi:unnamed protein product [Cylindrotheca closterium]|uniref:BTB domain-containing protein n=1 Tax=Cylindrotheca closterium TaxID=2856 RepID=A0AAD2FV71_9STRA|nr:unnamed protein product [Cylindrotheca closterium]